MNAFEEAYGVDKYKHKVLLEIGAPNSKALRDVGVLMKDATVQQFANFDRFQEETLQYGCCAGNPEFKEELAKYLSEMYRNPVCSQDLYVNAGSSQGVTNLLSHYFQPGDSIFIGDPTYWVLLGTLGHSDFNIVAIDVDEDGMRMDELEKALDKLEVRPGTKRHPYRAAVYVVPTYQNPMTVCMSEDRCRKLVELARRHDLLVIADDVYNLLTYSAPGCDNPAEAKPPARLFHYDDKSDPDYKGNVVSVGTFSKLLGPGLRLGWFEMPNILQMDFFQTLVSVGGNGRNPYTSSVVTAGLKSGAVQEHIKKMRCVYAERMKKVHQIITCSLEKYSVKCELPRGGIFLWILLPSGITTDDVLQLCGNEIGFITGQRCSFSGKCRNGIRICISFYEPPILYPAISKFCGYIIEALGKVD